MSRGIEFNAHYTWSHSIDGGSTWHSGATSANGFAAGDGFTTDQTMPALDRGDSVFDIRHRLTLNYVWELPFFRDGSGLKTVILGGWQLNGIWSFQSGAHWSPFDNSFPKFSELAAGACDANAQGFVSDPVNCLNLGGDYNLDGTRNDRPNAAADSVRVSHEQWANGWGERFKPNGEFFTSPCLGCVGNLGRNSFVGPGFWGADISGFKNFKVSERLNFQFRAEAFNVFNHTDFQLPGANSLGNNRINSLQFGQSAGTFNPRNLQFGFRLAF
jgi:hypothetical protein